MIVKCIKCQAENELTYLKTFSHKTGVRNKRATKDVFFDKHGRRHYGNICYDCQRRAERIHRGTEERNKSRKPRIRKAVRVELRAAQHFRRLGFRVKRTKMTGPDLICSIGNMTWMVEVKPVRQLRSPATGRMCNYWNTPAVTKNRVADDLLAMVLPNGRVYIDSMPLHLAACGKNGTRNVTAIVKEFGLPA